MLNYQRVSLGYLWCIYIYMGYTWNMYGIYIYVYIYIYVVYSYVIYIYIWYVTYINGHGYGYMRGIKIYTDKDKVGLTHPKSLGWRFLKKYFLMILIRFRYDLLLWLFMAWFCCYDFDMVSVMILDVGQTCDLKPTHPNHIQNMPKSSQNHIKIVSKPHQNRTKSV